MILTLYNAKGGVAKTTNTIHIGASLAKMGKSVLLVDLDPQCDTTKGCGVHEPTYTVKNLLDGTGQVKLLKRSDHFTILAGDPELSASSYKSNHLQKCLTDWKSHFDYIIIDCPPTPLNKDEITLPELALMACDYFIIPLFASPYAVINSTKVLSKVVEIIKPKNDKLNFAGFLFSNILVTATVRNKRHIDNITSKAPGSVFKHWIRTDAEIDYAIEEGLTIFQHKPNCRAAQDFIEVTKELLERTA